MQGREGGMSLCPDGCLAMPGARAPGLTTADGRMFMARRRLFLLLVMGPALAAGGPAWGWDRAQSPHAPTAQSQSPHAPAAQSPHAPAARSPHAPAAQASRAAATAKPVDINTASRAQLKTLPGIGDAEAAKIMAARPYLTKTGLVEKKVLSLEAYDALRDRVVVVHKRVPPKPKG